MAEVTVKVAARNEIKTGLQSALADVKAFGAEASRSGTPTIGGGELRKSLKGLGADLAAASTPAEAVQAVVSRVAGAFGKLTSIVAGFAVGRVISEQFEKVRTLVEDTSAALENFTGAMASASKAATFEEAISGFKTLGAQIDVIDEKIKKLKTGVGENLVTGALNLFGTNLFKELGGAKTSMQTGQAIALGSSLFNQREKKEELAAVGGDKNAEAEIERKFKRREQMEILDAQIQSAAPGTNARGILERAKQDLQGIFDAEDAGASNKFNAELRAQQSKEIEERNKERAQERKRKEAEDMRRPEFGPGTTEAATGGQWRIDARNWAMEEAQRMASEKSGGFTGGLTASSLQRIAGGEEFARSLNIDPSLRAQEKANSFLQSILNELKTSGTLILKENS
jgi:hypothetical protein